MSTHNGNEAYKALSLHDEADISNECIQDSSEEEEYPCSRRDILYQGFASLVAFSLVIHAGINLSLSTILHPQLEITKEQVSWIASLGAIGTPIGSISIGFLMDRIGRQKTLIVASAVTILAWSILCLLPSEFDIRLIYLSRFFEGFGSGMTSIAIVYVAETTNKHWRSTFLSINSIAVSIGILLTTTVGVFLTWRAFSLFCLSMITASAIVCFTLPESPSWLIQHHPELAKKALKRLVTNPKAFAAEWKILEPKQRKQNETHKIRKYDKRITKPLAVVVSLVTLQQFVGIYPTIFYSLELFQKINGGSLRSALNVTQIAATSSAEVNGMLREVGPASNWTESVEFSNSSVFDVTENTTNNALNFSLPDLDPAKSSLDPKSPAVLALMCLGVIRLVTSVGMTILSKYFGVRTLLMCSSLGVGVSSALFSLYQGGWCSQSSDTVAFAIILCFITFGNLGLLAIPWTLFGEILPMEFRGVGQGVTVAYAYVLMFFVVKFYPFFEDELGTSVVYFSFSVVAFITVGFVYFFVPETLGRTMDEIQMFFRKR